MSDFRDMNEPDVNEDESFLTVVIIVVKPYQGSVNRKEFRVWRCLLTCEEPARYLVPCMLSIAGVPSRHSASEGSIKFMLTSASSLSRNKYWFFSYFVEIKERGVGRCYRTFRLREHRSVDIVVHLAYEKFAQEMRFQVIGDSHMKSWTNQAFNIKLNRTFVLRLLLDQDFFLIIELNYCSQNPRDNLGDRT